MTEYFDQINQALGTYAGITAASYLVAMFILVLSFVAAQIVNFLFNKVFIVFTKRTKTDVDDEVMKILNMPIFYSVVLLGAYQSFIYIAALAKYEADFAKILKTVAAIIWIYAIAKLVRIIITEFGFKFAAQTKSTLDDELMPLFKKLSSIIIFFAGIMFILGVWKIDITPLLASAGIAGFVIAFAAKDTLSHLFGGISMYFDRPFKVGDRIQLESGEIGNVLEIGIRSTRVKTFDETAIVIPNSIIANSKIINYNQPEAKIKLKMKINAAYGSDIEKVKKTLLDTANKIEGIEEDPAPSVHFTNLGDYALEFLVIMWVDSPEHQFAAKTKMNEEVYNRFNKEGILIPFPTQSVYLKNKD